MSSHIAYQTGVPLLNSQDVLNKIVDGLSFETHKFLVEEGAAEVDWPVPRHGDRLAWAEFCIRHGADVNAFSPLSGEILLAMTARRSLVEMVDLLLHHGASLHDSGAVVAAAGDGRLDTLSVLLGRGANIREFHLRIVFGILNATSRVHYTQLWRLESLKWWNI